MKRKKTMENKTQTITVANATSESTIPVPANIKVKPVRKSKKGTWGKVGAPPKEIKFPRGSYTIKELIAFQGTYVNDKGDTVPNICDLTLRNYVTAAVRGYKIVKSKDANGKTVSRKVEVPVTIVRLPKNVEKDTVGRPNFRFMSKAAFEATRKNTVNVGKKVKVTAPAPTAETVTV